MNKLFKTFEIWLFKNLYKIVIFSILLGLYSLLSHTPYINVWILSEIPFELFISICLLFVFKPPVRTIIFSSVALLFVGLLMTMIGYVDYYDSFGNIIYAAIVYLLIYSLMYKGEK